jgi:hypothetical protein
MSTQQVLLLSFTLSLQVVFTSPGCFLTIKRENLELCGIEWNKCDKPHVADSNTYIKFEHMLPGTIGDNRIDKARKIAFASHLMTNIVIVSDVEDDDKRIRTSLCTCLLVLR